MKKRHIRGFSLVEFFVAIAISLLILYGLLQIFFYNKTTYNREDDLAKLQENGRFVNQYLSRIVRHGGYRAPPQPNTNNFEQFKTIFPTATLPYISGTNVAGSDTLSITYQGSGSSAGVADGLMRDCLNNPVGPNNFVRNTFSINANKLQCQVQTLNLAGAVTSTSTDVIVAGVENFQVLYGEDLNGDFSADRYVRAGAPGLDMGRVVSVRIGLVLRSNNQTRPIAGSSTFYIAGDAYTSPSDSFLRFPLTFTVTLRNLITQSV